MLSFNINTTILKSKLLSVITRIGASLPICYDISETPKFHKDYNFHSGIILGDAHSKHILIILAIDSWNFRELQESFAEFEKDRTRNRKSDNLLTKTSNFSRISILKPQNFMGRDYLK